MKIKPLTILKILAIAMLLPVGVSALPNGYISNHYAGTLTIVDIASNSIIDTISVGSDPRGVAVSPSGARVYVANQGSHTVTVVDALTNSVIKTIPVGSNPHGVDISPDGSIVCVAIAGADTVALISTSTHSVIDTVSVGDHPAGVVYNPAGTKILVTNYNDDTVSIIDTASYTVPETVNVGDGPWGIDVTPDGSHAYVSNFDGGTASVIDIAVGTTVKTITLEFGADGVAVHPTDNRVYIAAGLNLYYVDSSTNMVIDTKDLGSPLGGVSVHPNGSKIYAARFLSDIVSVIDTSTNDVIDTITLPDDSWPNAPVIGPNQIIAPPIKSIDGDWVGSSDQGLAVSFSVSENQVMHAVTRLSVSECGLTTVSFHGGTFPIDENDEFTINGAFACNPYQPWNTTDYFFDGFFENDSTCTGTWTYTVTTQRNGTWTASPKIVYADQNGLCGGHAENCYTSIQAAIDSANIGVTVVTYGGGYDENVEIYGKTDVILENGAVTLNGP